MGGSSGSVSIRAFEAGETMANAHVGVYLSAAGVVSLSADPAIDPCIGTTRTAAVSGAMVDVDLIGPVVLMRCSTTVTLGYPVSWETDGIANSATDGDMSCGIALESGTDGAEVEVVQAYFYNANVSKLIHGGS